MGTWECEEGLWVLSWKVPVMNFQMKKSQLQDNINMSDNLKINMYVYINTNISRRWTPNCLFMAVDIKIDGNTLNFYFIHFEMLAFIIMYVFDCQHQKTIRRFTCCKTNQSLCGRVTGLCHQDDLPSCLTLSGSSGSWLPQGPES